MSPKRVLITGARGQLGTELQITTPAHFLTQAVNSNDLDIRRKDDVMGKVSEFQPDWIIHAAAYTAVDAAEEETEQAIAINVCGTEHLALAAKACKARLIYISSDYVFDGKSPRVYKTDTVTQPLSVYGRSKRDGETKVIEILTDYGAIVRTSWVYGLNGHNFVKTILRLCAEKEQLNIVSDQIGTPTWARTLAQMIWSGIEKEISGIWHYSDAGVASWYDFAIAIQEIGLERGLLKNPVVILPITSDEFPQAAKRPAFSLLDKTATWSKLQLTPLHWRSALQQMMCEMRSNG